MKHLKKYKGKDIWFNGVSTLDGYLGAMAMKAYTALPRASTLLELQHQIV